MGANITRAATAIAVFWLSHVSAQSALEACPDAPSEFVTVAAVSLNLAIELEDGRTVALPGLESPRATLADPLRPQAVRDRLRRQLIGETVGLALIGPLDRWGARPALVFTEAGNLAELLLENGDVRFEPDPSARSCRAALLAAETRGRVSGAGLWSDASLSPLKPGTEAASHPTVDGMVLVEGEVTSIGETPTRVYLNLEPGRGGFAISLPKRDIALMRSDAISRARTVGTRVRVRGLIDRQAGSRIEVSDADAIEILTPPHDPLSSAPR